MEFDNELQEFNIELLKKICYNGNDFEFVFNNLTTVIKSLNALNKLLKQLESADDCIYNLPQIEEILSNLITNKVLLLNPEALTSIIRCIFEYSKFFKDESNSDFILSNVNLSNTQIWCIQRIRTLMITTEFPRSKIIRQIEESMKNLNYTTLEFYKEIVKEQISVLREYIILINTEKHFTENINEVINICTYMLDYPDIILPLIEDIILKRLIMEYTIIHEQEIVNLCQEYINIYFDETLIITQNENLASYKLAIKKQISNSLLLEILMDSIKKNQITFIQEFIIIFCNIVLNLDYIKIFYLFLYLLNFIKKYINYNNYKSLIEKIFPYNLKILFEILSHKNILNCNDEWIIDISNDIEFFKFLNDNLRKCLSYTPYFKISSERIDSNENDNILNIFQNNHSKHENINYQTMFKQIDIKDWLWIWINLLFYEVKHYAIKNLCKAFIEKDEITLSQDDIIDLYIEYIRIAFTLEYRHHQDLISNTIIDNILILKDILL
eukprot:jgi/Orpsp1_1/1175310/evm.model.c7180000053378.1